MRDLALERERYTAALKHDLDDVIQQLRDIPAVQKVLLFGSYATGRRDLFTDLDLLIVMHSSLDFVTRCAELAGRLHAGVAMDIFVYTPQEIERMKERPFIRQILKSGKVLYERESVS